jgi:uncharacterized protein YcnI
MNTITTPRPGTRTMTAAAVAALLATGLSPAAAHVSAEANTTAAGGYARITFAVPNESDTASTRRLELTLPEDTPFATVRTQPVEGWTAEITEEPLASPAPAGEGQITEAASTVTWTADADHAIGPGEFQTFTIQAGPLPEEEGRQIVLPVSQTYTDGRTVAWDQPAAEGQEEPEHPAPSLTVTAAEQKHGHGPAGGGETTAEGAGTAAAEGASARESTAGAGPGWAGLVAGLLGLAAGVTALVRSRRA